jgi:hypothetical protein
MKEEKEQGGRTTAIRDDLVVGGERCARADFAAVACDDSSDGAFSSKLGVTWGEHTDQLVLVLRLCNR